MKISNKIIQNGLAFRHEQSVTVAATLKAIGLLGSCPAGLPPLRGFGGDGARRRRQLKEGSDHVSEQTH